MLDIDKGTVAGIYRPPRVVGNAADDPAGISGWRDGRSLGTKEALGSRTPCFVGWQTDGRDRESILGSETLPDGGVPMGKPMPSISAPSYPTAVIRQGPARVTAAETRCSARGGYLVCALVSAAVRG